MPTVNLKDALKELMSRTEDHTLQQIQVSLRKYGIEATDEDVIAALKELQANNSVRAEMHYRLASNYIPEGPH